MFNGLKDLLRRRREKRPPVTMRDHACFVVVLLIFSSASGILNDWLGFGSGRNFDDLPNILLHAFWAGGVSVFVVQVLAWVEIVIRKLAKR